MTDFQYSSYGIDCLSILISDQSIYLSMFAITYHKEVSKNGTADVNNSDSRVTLVSIMTKMMHQVLLIFPKGRLCIFKFNIEHYNPPMKAYTSLVGII